MPSPRAQRAREQERRLAQLAAQDEAARAYRRKQRAFGVFGASVVVAAIGSVVWAGVRSNDNVATGQSTTSTTSTTLPDQASTPKNTAPPVSVPKAPAGESITGDTPCPALDGTAKRVTHFEKPPPMCIDPSLTYDVTMRTSKGDIHLSVANPAAPEIVNNFIVLAAYHYYDDMPIDFAKEGAWWEMGDYVDGPAGTTSPGYTIPYTGPDQIMTSIQVGMALQPGTKNVTGRLVVGFGPGSADIPPGTPTIGIILAGTEASQGVGKIGTASGAVTEANRIFKIDIKESIPVGAGSTTTTGLPASTVWPPAP